MVVPSSHVLDVYGVHLHLATTRRQASRLHRLYPALGKISMPTGWGGCAKFGHVPPIGIAQLHLAFWVDVAGHRGDLGALLDTCAHEATHAGCLILDDCDADYDGNSEPLAYLVGWLTRWLWEQVAA